MTQARDGTDPNAAAVDGAAVDAARARYRELTAKVDAFFGRVAERHGAQLQCTSGCADCCHAELGVSAIEADAVRTAVAALPTATGRALASRARTAPDPAAPRCAGLGDDDRCAIYAARPLVCRSHGVPVRQRDPRGLPIVDACGRNFTAAGFGGPAAADADCVLDQATLSTVLFALDAALAAATATPAGERTALRTLFAG